MLLEIENLTKVYRKGARANDGISLDQLVQDWAAARAATAGSGMMAPYPQGR